MQNLADTQPSKRQRQPFAGDKIVHNLNGQRLGRKGLITRERILTAASNLIAEQHDLQISLSAIASEASLGMTSVYNYFSDLTDVLIALLEKVMVDAEDAYLVQLRDRWDDDELFEESSAFVHAFFDFWTRNANLFHLRNNFSDSRDPKMVAHRASVAREIIALLMLQMGHVVDREVSKTNPMASAVYMGLERAVSVLNNVHLMNDLPPAFRPNVEGLLAAEAQLLAFAIRNQRGLGK